MSQSKYMQIVILIVLALLTTVAITFYPKIIIAVFGIVFGIIVLIPLRKRLCFWQKMIVLSLFGYVVLNYGFANITVFRIPIGHLLIFLATLIVLVKYSKILRELIKEPVFVCIFILMSLSFIHLITDIPQYGFYAIRDASFIFESFVLVVGYIWAYYYSNDFSFLRVLAVLFIFVLVYSFSYPFSELILSVSPQSGIFRPVSVAGYYAGISFFLVVGSAYYFLLGYFVLGWSKILISSLALVMAGWSFVFQTRSMYIGLLLVLMLLIIFSPLKKSIRTILTMVVGLLVLLSILPLFGVEGRVGEVNAFFLFDHFRSIFLIEGTPAVGSAHWRLQLLPELFERWAQNWSTIIVGEGFGQPLIDFTVEGVEVRQPHNTHLTVLARLGVLGFLFWSIFLLRIFGLTLKAIRITRRKKLEFLHSQMLWFLNFYILGILLTSVQPWLEFSYGSIPFFICIGYSIGLARMIIDYDKQESNRIHNHAE